MIDRSIVGAACAAKIHASLRYGFVVHEVLSLQHGTHDFVLSLSARRTTTTIVLVGSLLAPIDFQHVFGPSIRFRSALRSKNERASLNRSITAWMRESDRMLPLLVAREGLCQLAETRNVPDEWAEDPPIPNPMDYCAMTLEDVAAWRPLVEALEPATKA